MKRWLLRLLPLVSVFAVGSCASSVTPDSECFSLASLRNGERMEVENFTIGCFGGRSDKLKFTRGANGISVRGMAGNASLQGVVLDGSDVKKFDRMIARFQREDRHIQRKMKSDLERGMMVVGTSEGLRISKFQDTLRLSSAEFSGGSGIRDGSNLLTVHELIERMRNQRRAASARNHGVSRSSGPGIILPTP